MARNKGSANLSASLEVLAGAPLDAREVVQAKADLTASGSFPYKYVGMEVYVVAENKKYRFIGTDPTDIEDWEEVGSGSGGTSDYEDLTNKPTINGETLTGDMTSSDLGLQDAIQVDTMETASADLLGKVVQYVGATSQDYTQGYYYICASDGGDPATYSWEQLNVQPDNEGQIIQVDTLPTASASNEGQIYQFVGTTTQDYVNGYFYQSTSDGEATPTYSWVQVNVQPGSSGGDASLQSAVTSNLAVGAIASGTTLAQGTSFTEFVQKLLITEIAPTFSFSLSKSGNVAYGGSYTETLTLTCSNIGTAKKIKTIAWYEGSTLKQTDTIDSTTTGSWTYTMGTATTDSTTFKAIVTYTKSNDADDTQTKTASINFYYNKFYGAVADLAPTEATVEALTSVLATGKGGTYSFTTNASRICYAYPKSLGALSSIKDGNGFSLFNSFTRTEQTYTQNGTSVAYYRYVLTDPTTVSGYNVIFA